MKIEFVGPAEAAEDDGVIYNALVDGKTIRCHFSFEALQDMDPDNLHGNPLKQFEAHRLILLSAAEAKIQRGLVSGDTVNIYTNDVNVDNL
jgi:hypothetical protein